MHLIGTNLSLWIRTIIWESVKEWFHYLTDRQNYAARSNYINGSCKHPPPLFPAESS